MPGSSWSLAAAELPPKQAHRHISRAGQFRFALRPLRFLCTLCVRAFGLAQGAGVYHRNYAADGACRATAISCSGSVHCKLRQNHLSQRRLALVSTPHATLRRAAAALVLTSPVDPRRAFCHSPRRFDVALMDYPGPIMPAHPPRLRSEPHTPAPPRTPYKPHTTSP